MTIKSTICKWLVLLLWSVPLSRASAQSISIDSVINAASLKEVVDFLASDSLKGRFTGSDGAKKAASYIANEFQQAGLKPFPNTDSFFWHFLAKGPSSLIPTANVIATLEGDTNTRANELIVFCAHYDHVGTKSTNPHPDLPTKARSRRGDTIYNGANDNASGVAAIIHLARYFAQLKNNDRSVIFIAFSAEELGLEGSQEIVSAFKPEAVVAVINLEMLGRTISRKKKNPYITGSQYSDLKSLFNTALYEHNDTLYKHNFFRDDPFPSANLFSRSDNFWFAMKGIPAHTIMSTDPGDLYYHSTSDEPSTLDFDLMKNFVHAIAISSTGLISGKITPSRIQPRKITPRF